MKIRCETPSDDEAIARVNQHAFGRPNEAQLVERIRHSDRYNPALSLVAESDGAIVGHILLSIIDLVSSDTIPVLGLAPLAVHPSWQRQGIGSALVQAGLKQATATEAPLVIVLGHPAFYQRFGFEPASRYGISAPFPVPDANFMVQRLKPDSECDRGQIIYPAAFADV